MSKSRFVSRISLIAVSFPGGSFMTLARALQGTCKSPR